jgi:hypothetical protein
MPDNHKKQENDQKLVTACASLAIAVDQVRSSSDNTIMESIQQVNQQIREGIETGKKVGQKAQELGKEVVDSTVDTAKLIAESELGSLTKNNTIARLINDDFGPSKEEINQAQADVDRLSLKAQATSGELPTQISRMGFHKTSEQFICTSNAVVRCSFGMLFGQLLVPPFHRVCLGHTPSNPVANIMDCLPNNINIPHFGLCFNLLNPAVAAATTAATIAKGGVFTLTPAPCIGTMAPSPWIPVTKNLCGQMPLLTQSSMSLCWGIGSISILHCGQGLEASIANRFMVPGDVLATIKGYAETLLNLAGGLGGLVTCSRLAPQIANVVKLKKLENLQRIGKISQIEKVRRMEQINNVDKMAKLNRTLKTLSESQKLEKIADGVDTAGNIVVGAIAYEQGDAGDAAVAFAGVGSKIKGKKSGHHTPTHTPSSSHSQPTSTTSEKVIGNLKGAAKQPVEEIVKKDIDALNGKSSVYEDFDKYTDYQSNKPQEDK